MPIKPKVCNFLLVSAIIPNPHNGSKILLIKNANVINKKVNFIRNAFVSLDDTDMDIVI